MVLASIRCTSILSPAAALKSVTMSVLAKSLPLRRGGPAGLVGGVPDERVGAAAAGQRVGVESADDCIVVGAAVDDVVVGIAVDRVHAGAAKDRIGARAAMDLVAAIERVSHEGDDAV